MANKELITRLGGWYNRGFKNRRRSIGIGWSVGK